MFRDATFTEELSANCAQDDLPHWAQSHAMDETTFEEFYAETARSLWLYIRRVSGSAELADDLLQESFFRLLRAPRSHTREVHLKSYLYKIATNLIHDHRRGARREAFWRLRLPTREEAYEDSSLDSDTLRTFAKLKPQERALLWLAYVEGYEHREIAHVMELAEKSVRVLLFRARRKLAHNLEQKGIKAEVAL
ncbi:MAG: RNA polymerase sigma factor [Pyrinomonadaceae bacterium]|nr:RNA polymerase sigma factor [Pyrinomonadaceae bacterium]